MNHTIISNILWRFMERIGAKGISMIVQIILARLLLPEDYGVVALVTVFTFLLDIFVDSGLGSALIQKPDADELDFSTVFLFNIGMCSVLYLLLFWAAPWISRFYGVADMTALIRAAGIMLLISGLKNIQQAYVAKNMLFRKFFFATFGGTIFSAFVGIGMAYAGAGAWAIVGQHLSNALIDTLILWITVRWRPRLRFSRKRFRGLFAFGWRLLVSSLVENLYSRIHQLVIGKLYLKSDLAYYNQGEKYPNLIVINISTSINSVMLPALSREQFHRDRVKALVRRTVQVSAYLIWPLMLGMMACANSLVSLLLTDKWLPAVPFLRIACLGYAFFILSESNAQPVTALGRSDLRLRLTLVKKAVGIGILLLTLSHGVLAIALGEMVCRILSTAIDAWPNRSLIGYRYSEQLKDIFPAAALSCVMALLIYQLEALGLSPLVTLLLQIAAGAGFYVAGSLIFRLSSFRYILETGRQLLHRGRQ